MVFITNYESLLMKDLYAAFKMWQPQAIIFDESHALKTYNAKRSQLAERLSNEGPVVPYKQLLTGTPVLNNPMDLYHQFLVLDGGRTLGGNFFAFRGRFFRDRNAGMPKQKYFPKWEVMSLEKDGYDAMAELNRLIGHRSMHVTKAECMDLPPLVRQVIKVPMAPEQRRMYEEMKRDFVTFIDQREEDPKAVTAILAITKALRLQQIASGYVKTNEEEEIGLDGTPKMEALKQLLDQLAPSGKILVWAAWRNNYKQIGEVCDSLGLKYVTLVGGMTDASRNAAIEAFTKGDAHVLVGNPGSGGIGVNLVEAPYAIFYSRTFSMLHKVQAEARNYRGGSEMHEKVTHYDIVCENSIDEIIAEKLAEKIEMSDKLLGSLASQLKTQE
jgi:SNF2 family DNA or RNA helicase